MEYNYTSFTSDEYVPIKYLHQLQNLYFVISETDLQIDL